MPLLPNADTAYIEPQKVAGYLLNDTHNVGGPKSAFFKGFGFSADEPQVLEAALLVHARQHDAIARPVTIHGQKFEIVGPLACPDGRMPKVKAIWIVDPDETAARLVTAFPA